MEKKTIRDIDVKGRKVLVRCDFNVPMEDGKITDDNRIVAALPTIKYLLENGAKVVLCSHLGRPKGEKNQKYSLSPVAASLSEKLGQEVKLAEDVTGTSAKQMADNLKEGEAGLLENVRFDPREEKNEDSLAIELADLVGTDGIYVNDAFGTAHRAHSSTEGVTHHVKESVAGFLMEKEVTQLGAVLESPQKPYVAILGGAKVSDKIGVIQNLLEKVNALVIGGAMANTFLKAKGIDIGNSKYEEDKLEEARRLMKEANEKGIDIVLPVDARVARIPVGAELTLTTINEAESKKVKLHTQKEVEEGKAQALGDWCILDIGEVTLNHFASYLEEAKTVVWNGPMGYAEATNFAHGTVTLANFIAHSNTHCVIGGGDSVAAVKKVKNRAIEDGENPKQFDNVYLSTGGGAAIELLEGRRLPGIEALSNKAPKINKNTMQGLGLNISR